MTRVIGVVSGKGGAGKTTTSINLSMALMELGKSVTLIDANVNAPNVSLHLGMDFRPATIEDILNGEYAQQALYVHSSGLRVVPADITVEKPEVDLTTLKDHIHKFVGDSDYVIIDCAPGLGPDARGVIEACDEFLVVTNAEIPATTDAYRAARAIRRSGGKVLGVVLNKYTGERDELAVEEVERFMNNPVISVVPHDKNVRRSIQRQTPLLQFRPTARASFAFRRLAKRLEGRNETFFERVMTVIGF